MKWYKTMCVRVLCTSRGLLSLYNLIRFPSPKEPGVETPEWWSQLCEGRDCSLVRPLCRQCLAPFLAQSKCSIYFGGIFESEEFEVLKIWPFLIDIVWKEMIELPWPTHAVEEAQLLGTCCRARRYLFVGCPVCGHLRGTLKDAGS